MRIVLVPFLSDSNNSNSRRRSSSSSSRRRRRRSSSSSTVVILGFRVTITIISIIIVAIAKKGNINGIVTAMPLETV